jgi:hypothetical protein
MFLFVLLLIAIFLYVEEYLENKINNVLIKPIEKLENIYDSIINRIKNI